MIAKLSSQISLSSPLLLSSFLPKSSIHSPSSSSTLNSSVLDIVKPLLNLIRFPLMNFKELIREVRPLGIIDDLQYIQALEFNADFQFFENQKNLQFQQRKGTQNEKKIFKIQNDYYFLPGPNYSLSNNNKIITKTGNNNGWDVTAITNSNILNGIHRWSLKIINTQNSNFMIGIAPNSINQSQQNNYNQCGWYFYTYNSTLHSGPPFKYAGQSYCNNGKLTNGTIIDLELNMNNSTIKYFINGQDCGVAYQGIPTNQTLKFVVLLLNTNDCVELLSYSSSS